MRLLQVLTTISFGDAVSNDTLALHDTLVKQGYKTKIFAENIDRRILQKYKYVSDIKRLDVEIDDVIIYHMSTGTKLNYDIAKYPCKKIMIYHNVTPPEFYQEYSSMSYTLCKQGLQSLDFLKDKFDYVIGDSQFNIDELIKIGFTAPMRVLPILIPFEDYKQKPSGKVIHKYENDGYENILFTGRIAPNKKQEDVIMAFYHYKKYYNPKSRLFLVGNSRGMEIYKKRLEDFVAQLGVEDVIFTEHIPFDQILAYYTLADLFLCLSEHEGFCVPIVEAMQFEIPIVARGTGAVPDTLQDGGLVVTTKNPLEVAGIMDYLLKNEQLKNTILENQKNRLAALAHDVVEAQFLGYLKEFLENYYEK